MVLDTTRGITIHFIHPGIDPLGIARITGITPAGVGAVIMVDGIHLGTIGIGALPGVGVAIMAITEATTEDIMEATTAAMVAMADTGDTIIITTGPVIATNTDVQHPVLPALPIRGMRIATGLPEIVRLYHPEEVPRLIAEVLPIEAVVPIPDEASRYEMEKIQGQLRRVKE